MRILTRAAAHTWTEFNVRYGILFQKRSRFSYNIILFIVQMKCRQTNAIVSNTEVDISEDMWGGGVGLKSPEIAIATMRLNSKCCC